MLFFRVMLCVAGLMLYMVIKEFSAQPVVAGPRNAPPIATPAEIVGTLPPPPAWEAVGSFQPAVATPAEHRILP